MHALHACIHTLQATTRKKEEEEEEEEEEYSWRAGLRASMRGMQHYNIVLRNIVQTYVRSWLARRQAGLGAMLVCLHARAQEKNINEKKKREKI